MCRPLQPRTADDNAAVVLARRVFGEHIAARIRNAYLAACERLISEHYAALGRAVAEVLRHAARACRYHDAAGYRNEP